VSSVVSLIGLLKPEDTQGQQVDVLNGIAYDAGADRIFVTGKYWPKTYEIKIRDIKPASLN
jgi:glutamine cyclotransferase